MSGDPLSVRELFLGLLHREPADWELDYWGNELANNPFEAVFRRLTSYDEHKRFLRDNRLMGYPAGHFYSPIVDLDYVDARRERIFDYDRDENGVDLNVEAQLRFVDKVKETAASLPFSEEKGDKFRYHYDNNAFVYGDAVVYAAIIDNYRPKRIFEVGSGYSSALALDVRDILPDYQPVLHFIEPYPQLLETLLSEADKASVRITPTFVQDVPLETFDELESGDIYFIDTTHIVKTGSDVVHHFENILPRLPSGVIVHIHDIFYPFEYPEHWVFNQKLSWNELYYFSAFIKSNDEYEILFFNNFMRRRHYQLMADASPMFAKNGGGSIWLRKR